MKIPRTKIICTIGPASRSLSQMRALIAAGMNVARLNFSHGSHDIHQETIERLKQVREELGVPLAIMLDTKGPEIRVGAFDGEPIPLEPGGVLKVNRRAGNSGIFLTPEVAFASLKLGQIVLFDDGYIATRVKSVSGDIAELEVLNSGVLKSQKGVNMPGAKLNLPAMTDQDILDIAFGCRHDVDLIAASFIRSASHVLEIKQLLAKCGKPEIQVIAKIESREGVHNFDQILAVADGIMVARGDLGVEMPIEEVPGLQKMMIRKSYLLSRPVVTATQILESMIEHPRPTRAEVSDVANAIYDSTSAVMLSGETAAGKYPIEAVKIMRKVIEQSESEFDYRSFHMNDLNKDYHNITTSIASAAVRAAYTSEAKAIFAFTTGGRAARFLSRFRPEMPIIALTSNPKLYHQMAFNWGVIPVIADSAHNLEEAIHKLSAFALQKGLVEEGDLVVITGGEPYGVSGTTNMMMIETIGKILLRGKGGDGVKSSGPVKLFFEGQEMGLPDNGTMIVCLKFNEEIEKVSRSSAGIILANEPSDLDSENRLKIFAHTYQIPYVIQVEEAFSKLKEGMFVSIDPHQGVVYTKSTK